jgi:hypothetical protein
MEKFNLKKIAIFLILLSHTLLPQNRYQRGSVEIRGNADYFYSKDGNIKNRIIGINPIVKFYLPAIIF